MHSVINNTKGNCLVIVKHIKNRIRCGKDLPSSIWISCKVRPRPGQNRYTVRGGGTNEVIFFQRVQNEPQICEILFCNE